MIDLTKKSRFNLVKPPVEMVTISRKDLDFLLDAVEDLNLWTAKEAVSDAKLHGIRVRTIRAWQKVCIAIDGENVP